MNAWAIASLVFVPLLLAEFGEVSPWLAVKVLRLGARFVGDRERSERYKEEWVAGLDTVPGKLTKLLKALGICLYAVPLIRVQVRGDLYRWRCFRLWHAVVAACMPSVAGRMAKKRAGNYPVFVRGPFNSTLGVLMECLERISSSGSGNRWRIIPSEEVVVHRDLRMTLDHKQGKLFMEAVDDRLGADAVQVARLTAIQVPHGEE